MSAGVLHDTRSSAAVSRAGLRALGHAFVWITIFTSFFVQKEPAPYDLLILAAAALYVLCGMVIPRRITGLIVLIAGFIADGMLSLTRGRNTIRFSSIWSPPISASRPSSSPPSSRATLIAACRS